jgi:hypothetical protein
MWKRCPGARNAGRALRSAEPVEPGGDRDSFQTGAAITIITIFDLSSLDSSSGGGNRNRVSRRAALAETAAEGNTSVRTPARHRR